jgi:hypothetical protein
LYLSAMQHHPTQILRAELSLTMARAKDAPNHSGPWGKVLACFITLGIALSFWFDQPDGALQGGIRLLVDAFGYDAMAVVFTVAAVTPIVALLLAPIWLRILSTGFALVLWLSILLLMMFDGDIHIRQAFLAIAIIAAFVNGEVQLARRVAKDRRLYGRVIH